MTIAQNDETIPLKTLRLWPGVLAGMLIVLFKVVGPIVGTGAPQLGSASTPVTRRLHPGSRWLCCRVLSYEWPLVLDLILRTWLGGPDSSSF